jgi:hypothetical protein
LAQKLNDYERGRARLKLSDDSTEQPFDDGILLRRGLSWALLGVVGAPVALYGWAHRLLPTAMVRWVATRITNPAVRKAQTPHISMLVGLVAFGGCYGCYVWLVYHWFGWPAAVWYAWSLPVAGLFAHCYLRWLRRFAEAVRTVVILARVPFAAKRLGRLHSELVDEIEGLRMEYRRALQSQFVT